MSTEYWDLYVYYVKKCVRENYINDIDPNHYEMEWNHFWPKSIFGNWKVGHWLTKKQHAIASALQTLVFKENCMYSTHKSYLPLKLLELAWPYYCEASKRKGIKGAAIAHADKTEDGKSILSLKMNEVLHSVKDENGKSVAAVRAVLIAHEEKNEDGKSILGLENGVRINNQKDKNGKSVNAVKGGTKAAAIVNSRKNENGKSLAGVKGSSNTNSQMWKSTIDGYINNAGAVANYNRRNGWPGDARVRLS